jgi:alpha/beta superfamily hydrolase
VPAIDLVSDGLHLQAYRGEPQSTADTSTRRRRALLIAHGFPEPPQGAAATWVNYPELADRIAADTGYLCLAVALRGVAGSEGDFSMEGWLTDLGAAVDLLCAEDDVQSVWACGFGLGGTLALSLAARDERISGVASFAAPADVDEWASDPRRFLDHARSLGVIKDPTFPRDTEAWVRGLRATRPLEAISAVVPRPVLVVHGSDDDKVPLFDARALADAAEGMADLRVITGAEHHLRHDPRAVAMLMGWLERQP